MNLKNSKIGEYLWRSFNFLKLRANSSKSGEKKFYLFSDWQKKSEKKWIQEYNKSAKYLIIKLWFRYFIQKSQLSLNQLFRWTNLQRIMSFVNVYFSIKIKSISNEIWRLTTFLIVHCIYWHFISFKTIYAFILLRGLLSFHLPLPPLTLASLCYGTILYVRSSICVVHNAMSIFHIWWKTGQNES